MSSARGATRPVRRPGCGRSPRSWRTRIPPSRGWPTSSSPRATRSRACCGPMPIRSPRSCGRGSTRTRRRMRWVVVAGEVEPGTGPATQRTGPAFLRARERLDEATSRRDGLPDVDRRSTTDRLLDDLAPILAELLGDLTPTPARRRAPAPRRRTAPVRGRGTPGQGAGDGVGGGRAGPPPLDRSARRCAAYPLRGRNRGGSPATIAPRGRSMTADPILAWLAGPGPPRRRLRPPDDGHRRRQDLARRRGLAGPPRPRARRRALPRAGRARVRRAGPVGPRRDHRRPRRHRPDARSWRPARAEARALAEARRRHEGAPRRAGLGRAWTPLPAVYFALDQLAHLAVIAVAWAIWLAGQAPTVEWSAAIGRVLGARDQAVINEVSLVAVVVLSLLIVNIRAGALFVATLVRPIEAATGSDEAPDGHGRGGRRARPRRPAKRRRERPRGWSLPHRADRGPGRRPIRRRVRRPPPRRTRPAPTGIGRPCRRPRSARRSASSSGSSS